MEKIPMEKMAAVVSTEKDTGQFESDSDVVGSILEDVSDVSVLDFGVDSLTDAFVEFHW
jgi:hypothetical protein